MPYNKSVYFSFGKTALRYLSTNLPLFVFCWVCFTFMDKIFSIMAVDFK